MAILDAITTGAPQTVYLFPTPMQADTKNRWTMRPDPSEILHFQYWPQSLADDHPPSYVEHVIPGGSHPLYQWVAGGGRTLSFEAIFTSELNTTRDPVASVGGATAENFVSLTPSSNFTVDVAAALSKLKAFARPYYPNGGQQGITQPPQILTLVFPGTKLNGSSDSLNVILRNAPVTIEAWYPDGQIRVATVSLTFNEVVQLPGSAGGKGAGSNVKFVGRNDFETHAKNYKFRGLADRAAT